jgi:predicted ATP-binding protein involved in virulence
MRIDQITIRNFKGFELRTFDFPRAPKGTKRQGSFHLLVGENGSGKSSTLDALAVALGIWHVARPTAGWRAIRPGEARWQPVRHGDRMSFEPMPDPSIEAKGVVGDKEVGWTRMNRGNSSKTSNAAAQEALDEVTRMLGRSRKPEETVLLPVLAHYSAGRAWLPQKDRVKGFPLNMKKGSRLDAYYYCLDGRIRDKELNQWFLYEMLESSQRRRKRDGLVAVENAVLSCLPDAKGLRFDTDRKEIVVILQSGEEMPFYNLSDGQRSTLALVADIAIKAVTLNPHLGKQAALKSPGVVMIDELDLHLHPKWQRRVIDDLKRTFPELQFICSTHSPFLIQSLRPGELIVLQEGAAVGEYANQSLEDIVESVQGVAMPQRSHRAEVMSQAVEEYVKEIKKPRATKTALKRAELKYREKTEPYSPNPGLNALLKLQAMAAVKK